MRGLLKVIGKGDDVAEFAGRIEATKAAASKAYADTERLQTERRPAGTFEAARAPTGEIPRPGPIFPRIGALVINGRGETQPPAPPPKSATAPSGAEPAQQSTSPAPPPNGKSQARHDGAPAPGERQIHLMAAGSFNLPDGSRAKAGDRVNLPGEISRKYVEERGVANYVDVQAEPAAEPDTVEVVVAAKL